MADFDRILDLLDQGTQRAGDVAYPPGAWAGPDACWRCEARDAETEVGLCGGCRDDMRAERPRSVWAEPEDPVWRLLRTGTVQHMERASPVVAGAGYSFDAALQRAAADVAAATGVSMRDATEAMTTLVNAQQSVGDRLAEIGAAFDRVREDICSTWRGRLAWRFAVLVGRLRRRR